MKTSTVLVLAIGALWLAAPPGALAQGHDAYLQDTRGGLVRSADFGDPRIGNLCWRTGYWTPARAIGECDRDLIPMPVAAQVVVDPVQPSPPHPIPFEPETRVVFGLDVFFDFDKAVIKPQAKAKLDELVVKLQALILEVVVAVGHADAIGGDSYNDKLSMRRGEVVKAYLVSKGVEAKRIYVEGKGKHQPVADNKNAEGRARNRRVEIEVVGASK